MIKNHPVLLNRAPTLHRGPAPLLLFSSAHGPLEQQGAEDDGEQRHLHQTGPRVVPQQELFDHAEPQSRGEGGGEAVHAGDDRAGERPQQQRRAERLARGVAARRQHEDGGEG